MVNAASAKPRPLPGVRCADDYDTIGRRVREIRAAENRSPWDPFNQPAPPVYSGGAYESYLR